MKYELTITMVNGNKFKEIKDFYEVYLLKEYLKFIGRDGWLDEKHNMFYPSHRIYYVQYTKLEDIRGSFNLNITMNDEIGEIIYNDKL